MVPRVPLQRDNPKRDWYVWADPAPDGGPPNNWMSAFTAIGPAGTCDGRPGSTTCTPSPRPSPTSTGTTQRSRPRCTHRAVLARRAGRRPAPRAIIKFAKDPELRDTAPPMPRATRTGRRSTIVCPAAARRRGVPRPDDGRRAVGQGPRPLRHVPQRRRDAPGTQLRVRRPTLGCGCSTGTSSTASRRPRRAIPTRGRAGSLRTTTCPAWPPGSTSRAWAEPARVPPCCS